YPRIARLPGVDRVEPGLELDAGIPGTERTIRVIGVDALQRGEPDLLAPDTVRLSPLAQDLIGNGERLVLMVGTRAVELEVLGEADLHGVAALTDIATAQWRLGRLGELNRLDVRVARGANRDEVQQRVAALLPPGVQVAPLEALAQA